MQTVLHLISKHKMLSTLLFSALLMNFIPERTAGSLRSASLPVLRGFGKIAGVFGSSGGGESIGSEHARITALEREVRDLKASLAATDEQIRQMKIAIRHLADLDDAFDISQFRVKPARVIIRRDMSNFRKTLLINRGRSDGIRKGMPVVAGRAVVGLISSVSGSASQVQLLVDPAFRARARLAAEGAEGIAQGTGAEEFLLKLKFVQARAAPKIGEAVLTTGYQGRFPAGLLIGTVSEAERNPSADFYTISVKPVIRWDSLEVVEVVVGPGRRKVRPR